MRIPKRVQESGAKSYDAIEYNPRKTTRKRGNVVTVATVDRYKAIFAFRTGSKWTPKTKSCATKKEAKEWIQERIREHEKKGGSMAHLALTLRRYYDDVYKPDFLEPLTMARTEKSYVEAAIEFFGEDMPLQDIRAIQLRQFKRFLENGKRGERAVAGYLVRLRALLKQAEADEVVASAPSFKGLIPSTFAPRQETFSHEEYLRLLDACGVERNGHKREHLRPVIIGLYALGCRPVELHKVQVKDIDLSVGKRGVVWVWTAKKKKGAKPEQRPVPISSNLREWLDESRIMELPTDALVFGKKQDFKHAWATVLDIAGIDRDVHLNDFRHTAITNAHESGMPEADIKKIYGHSTKSRVTSEVYTNQRIDYLAEQAARVDAYLAMKEKVVGKGSPKPKAPKKSKAASA